MTRLRLGPIAEDRPVRMTIDVPAAVHRDLTTYADAHAEATGQANAGPAKLIVPMLVQFMATDRGFARAKRQRS